MKIQIGDKLHSIDTRKITVVCPGAEIHENIKYPGCIPIDMMLSLDHLNQIKEFHKETARLLLIVFPKEPQDYLRELMNKIDLFRRTQGSGVKHTAGRIDLTLRLQDLGVPFVWKYPEASLHPSAEVNLADVIIELYRRGRPKSVVIDEELAALSKRLSGE